MGQHEMKQMSHEPSNTSGPRLKLLQFVVEASFDAFVEGRN
jgi:hypothetical protein